jgi:cell division protease FtsH
MSAPDRDRLNYDEDALTARIRVALGGRAAEELIYGKHTTGAESDLEQITAIARQMVGRWGMSDLVGPMTAFPPDTDSPLMPGAQITSPETQRLVDEEVRRIVTEAHQYVLGLLAEHRENLDALTQALMEHETLDQEHAYQAAGIPLPSALGARAYAPAQLPA